MSEMTLDRVPAVSAAGSPEVTGTAPDDLAALFDLDARSLPVPDITGSNTTTDCTDNGCSATCPSVGCTPGCK